MAKLMLPQRINFIQCMNNHKCIDFPIRVELVTPIHSSDLHENLKIGLHKLNT